MAARRRLPAWSIRLRLALTYGLVFLVTGAALLTVGYLLVRHDLGARDNVHAILQRSGITDDFDYGRLHPGSPYAGLIAAARAQLRAQTLHRLLIAYVSALFVTTIAAVASGWWLAGRALAPLRRITATARRVSGRNLGERIALQGPADELRELADTFDGMLARLDAAFASQRHFVANASHELRTPLAIMRTELDVTLADERASAQELRATAEALRETIDRCERLIESLLTLARSEALSGRGEPVDLAELIADCVTDLRARAQEAEVRVESELAPCLTHGERALLERMIANLIDNGIRHNVAGGYLRIATFAHGEQVGLSVQNGGAVIAPEAAATLAEPFRRIDRSVEGFGLGLSIVRSVVEAHGGRLQVQASSAGGLSVRVALPAAERGVQAGQVGRARTLSRS